MSHVVRVKGIVIGEGAPKICVPLTGSSLAQLQDEAVSLRTRDFDLVEWRGDFFDAVEDIDQVKAALAEIRAILGDIPLIFTFRSVKEGGAREVSEEFYLALNTVVITSGLADIIDLELFIDAKEVKELVKLAHGRGMKVIISNHDFEKTPPKEEIVARLLKAQQLGGDLPKIAVMPRSPWDVLTLLEATLTMKEQYAQGPLITMAMAELGMISRLSGELFGSAVTFGAAKRSSAPGQVGVGELREILTLLHHNL